MIKAIYNYETKKEGPTQSFLGSVCAQTITQSYQFLVGSQNQPHRYEQVH